ncbi:MAG TPA: hypothetical protein VNH22_05365 [Blastocatellia bacterium]|nr:hypothetical protein [Blastocatellia bacterium]
MGKMGRYCKAYPVSSFRKFEGWTENLQNLRKEKREVDGEEVQTVRDLREDDFFYLQENHVVTDGIFIDQDIIFDEVTPEWISFCEETLGFKVPD